MRIQRVLAALPVVVLMNVLSLAAQQGGTAPGGGKDSPAKTGIIQVSDYDWGTVAPGKLKADIQIKNVGKGMLNISQVHPGCGCTIPDALSDSSLDPGQTVMLHLSLNAANRTGSILKTVSIYSDDPNTAVKVINLKANLQQDISFNPDQWILFNNVVVGKEAQASIDMQNTSTKPVTIYPPEVNGANYPVHFSMTKEKVLQPGEKLQLNVFVTPNAAQPITGKVLLKTSAENVASREVTLAGTVMQQGTATAPDAASSISGSHDTKNK